MSLTKEIARDWLPPALCRWIRQRRDGGIHFEGEFASWEEASSYGTGYDAENILAKVLEATLKVKQGIVAFERDSVVFDKIEYNWPVMAGLLRAAAQDGGSLNVLDFGGALGSSYFQSRNFLETLTTVRWNVVEQTHYVEAGRAYIQDEKLRFWQSIRECLTENQPNAILLSSVLQYLPDPSEIFSSLLDAGAHVVILDRTIVNCSDSDRIYVQHVPSSIYTASYPCRSLSQSRLLMMARERYRLDADFLSLTFPAIDRIQSHMKGYLLTKMPKM